MGPSPLCPRLVVACPASHGGGALGVGTHIAFVWEPETRVGLRRSYYTCNFRSIHIQFACLQDFFSIKRSCQCFQITMLAHLELATRHGGVYSSKYLTSRVDALERQLPS